MSLTISAEQKANQQFTSSSTTVSNDLKVNKDKLLRDSIIDLWWEIPGGEDFLGKNAEIWELTGLKLREVFNKWLDGQDLTKVTRLEYFNWKGPISEELGRFKSLKYVCFLGDNVQMPDTVKIALSHLDWINKSDGLIGRIK